MVNQDRKPLDFTFFVQFFERPDDHLHEWNDEPKKVNASQQQVVLPGPSQIHVMDQVLYDCAVFDLVEILCYES